MHARISTWRFPTEDRDRLIETLAPALAELRRQPGYIAGYGVEPGPGTSITFTVWESEEQLEAGFGAIAAALQPFLAGGQMELVDRKSGPAAELGLTTRT